MINKISNSATLALCMEVRGEERGLGAKRVSPQYFHELLFVMLKIQWAHSQEAQ